MEAVEVIADSLELNAGLIKMALEGLSDADLSTQPNDQSNPVGWLVWHQTRVEDVTISGLTQSAQVWGEGGWKAKFGVDVEDEDTGVGHSLEKVASMAFTKENLLGYAGAVRGKTLSALKGFTPADLDKEVPYPGGGGGGNIKVGTLLGRFSIDHFQHSGQVCYLRGYLTGFGWFPM